MSATWADIRDKVTKATQSADRANRSAEALSAKVKELEESLRDAEAANFTCKYNLDFQKKLLKASHADEIAFWRFFQNTADKKGVYAHVGDSLSEFASRYVLPPTTGGFLFDLEALRRDSVQSQG